MVKTIDRYGIYPNLVRFKHKLHISSIIDNIIPIMEEILEGVFEGWRKAFSLGPEINTPE